MSQPILETRDLVKTYGALKAVDGVSFRVEEGEVFGLLGPNGAGKSTILSMLTGLFPPDSGTIRIIGCDAVNEVEKIKQLIGVVPQDVALYQSLSAWENLHFFGEMYGLSGARLTERIESVLEYVGMTGRAKDPVRTYSGGMKRRINLAVGLVHNPRLLFLDEPTVGVDTQSRNHIFDGVERLNREQGVTVLYTTHYIDEAQRLCHRVAILDKGKIIAMDSPRNLIDTYGGGIIRVGLAPRASAEEEQSLCEKITALSQVKAAAVQQRAGSTGERLTLNVETYHANEALLQVIQLFNLLDIEILSVETLEPNLETVFLQLTGKSLRQ